MKRRRNSSLALPCILSAFHPERHEGDPSIADERLPYQGQRESLSYFVGPRNHVASAFEKHRIYGTGPRYSKLGGRVVYRLEDLQSWVESGAKASTSDPGASAVLPAKRHPAAAQPQPVPTRR